MRAVSISSFGGVEVLEIGELSDPAPRRDQVVVAVKAASINPRDWMIRGGNYFFQAMLPSLPFVLGSDLAGVVHSVGVDVAGFKVGDEVVAMVPSSDGFGAYAELAAVRASVVAKKPPEISFEQAGALPLAGLTALQALRDRGQLQSGQRVVIVGASGGVGHYAVQIARALGAREVIGVCSEANVGLALELGCDQVVDYRQQNFYDTLTDVDLVFDAIGRVGFSAACRAMTPRGIYVTTVPTGRGFWDIATTAVWRWGRRASIVLVKSSLSDLEQLLEWMQAGQLRSVIDRREPLMNVAELHSHSRSFRTRGKNILLPEI